MNYITKGLDMVTSKQLIAVLVVLVIVAAVPLLWSSATTFPGQGVYRVTGGGDGDGWNFSGDVTMKKQIIAVYIEDIGTLTAEPTVITMDGTEVYEFELAEGQKDCFCPPIPVKVKNFVITDLQEGTQATIIVRW